MAGRYQGHHHIAGQNGKNERGFEVIWLQSGWFWRPSPSNGPSAAKAVGPFTTSSEAYHDARKRLVHGDAA